MKISLVTSSPQVVNWNDDVKKTTTINTIAREVETQHTVAMRMLCGQKASDIIPDIFSDCFLTVDEFTTQLKVQPDDELTREIVEWIKTTARAKRECVIHIAFMDYVDGYDTFTSFYTQTSTLAHQLPTLYQAVAVILTLLLKGRIMSYDFIKSNLLVKDSKVMCLDLGRIYDFSKADTLSVLKKHMNQFVGSYGKRNSKIFDRFFNVAQVKENIDIKVSNVYERLLKKTDDEVYGFSSLSLDDKHKFVYETLIFIAFIDGITNKVEYGLYISDNNTIMFSHVLRRVFRSINGDALFGNFDRFLSTFTIDYDEFCTLNRGLVHNINIALDQISGRLAVMLGECPSQHYPPSYFDFSVHPAGSASEPVSVPASSSASAATAAAKSNDTGFTQLGPKLTDGGFFPDDPAGLGFGGSKRLRRRNSNKKRKHKSRNKQTHRRRRRRRNSTRRRVTRHH
jgi:hypothetical protein